MGHIIKLDNCLSILYFVASFKGSERLKHVPYYGVAVYRDLVVHRFAFFLIKFEWGTGVVIYKA